MTVVDGAHPAGGDAPRHAVATAEDHAVVQRGGHGARIAAMCASVKVVRGARGYAVLSGAARNLSHFRRGHGQTTPAQLFHCDRSNGTRVAATLQHASAERGTRYGDGMNSCATAAMPSAP